MQLRLPILEHDAKGINAVVRPVRGRLSIGHREPKNCQQAQRYSAFLDQFEIPRDRSSGYQILTFDSAPSYEDTTLNRAILTRRKYLSSYRLDVLGGGQRSAEASVSVG